MKMIFRESFGLLLVSFVASTLLYIYSFPYAIYGSRYLFGFPSDKLSAVWDFWWRHNAVDLGYEKLSSPLIEAPWVVNFSGIFDQHVYLWIRDFLGAFFNVFNVFNALFYLVILISFSGVLYLTKQLTKSSFAGFFSATSFATSQYLYWHATQNIEISLSAAFLPFLVLFLFRLEDSLASGKSKEGFLLSVLSGLTMTLILFTSYYIGYFALLSLIGFFCFRRLIGWATGDSLKNSLKVLGFYLLTTVTILVFTFPILSVLLGFSREGVSGKPEFSIINLIRGRSTVNELIAFGARPWDYLLPSSSHPIFGEISVRLYLYLRGIKSFQFWSVFLPERPNYIPYTVSLLVLILFIKAVKSHFRKDRYFPRLDWINVTVLLLFSTWMFFVSLPAVITVRGITFYLPSFFLFKILPEFRVYPRAGVFVLLGMSVLGGYGWAKLFDTNSEKAGSIRSGKLWAVLFSSVILVLFENLNTNPTASMDIEKIPQVYQWLAKQKEEMLVIEYPKDNSTDDIGGGCPEWLPLEITRDYNHAYEIFYSRIHLKKLFGYNHLEPEERSILGNLGDEKTYNLLKKYGVTTVVVHTKDPMIGLYSPPYPQNNPLDECWERRITRPPVEAYDRLIKIAQFDDGVIYKVQ